MDKPTFKVSLKKTTQFDNDFDDSKELINENTDIISDGNKDDSYSNSGEAPSEHLYEKYHKRLEKYHKRLDHVLPSHLPGRQNSFQAYLKSTYPQSSNFDVERAHLQS